VQATRGAIDSASASADEASALARDAPADIVLATLWFPLFRATLDADRRAAAEAVHAIADVAPRALVDPGAAPSMVNAINIVLETLLDGRGSASTKPPHRLDKITWPIANLGHLARAGTARWLARAGQSESARALLGSIAASMLADLDRDMYWPGTVWAVSDAVYELGDEERAQALYESVVPFDGLLLIDPAGVFSVAPITPSRCSRPQHSAQVTPAGTSTPPVRSIAASARHGGTNLSTTCAPRWSTDRDEVRGPARSHQNATSGRLRLSRSCVRKTRLAREAATAGDTTRGLVFRANQQMRALEEAAQQVARSCCGRLTAAGNSLSTPPKLTRLRPTGPTPAIRTCTMNRQRAAPSTYSMFQRGGPMICISTLVPSLALVKLAMCGCAPE
jgi:hypothetical protein